MATRTEIEAYIARLTANIDENPDNLFGQMFWKQLRATAIKTLETGNFVETEKPASTPTIEVETD